MSYVYFIQGVDGGPVKIGTATDPQARLAGIQPGNPLPLKILRTIEGGVSLERALHRYFAEDRLQGEWFEASKGLLEMVEGDDDIAGTMRIREALQEISREKRMGPIGVPSAQTCRGYQAISDDCTVNLSLELYPENNIEGYCQWCSLAIENMPRHKRPKGATAP